MDKLVVKRGDEGVGDASDVWLPNLFDETLAPCIQLWQYNPSCLVSNAVTFWPFFGSLYHCTRSLTCVFPCPQVKWLALVSESQLLNSSYYQGKFVIQGHHSPFPLIRGGGIHTLNCITAPLPSPLCQGTPEIPKLPSENAVHNYSILSC